MSGFTPPRHLLSVNDLTANQILEILDRAKDFDLVGKRPYPTPSMQEKVVATLFFQPSTRTQYGFQSTILRMGGKIINVDLESSRAGSNWGESLEDTAKIISGFADLAILRHPSADGLYAFAKSSTIPVINAGNGMGLLAEHPTQALLDLYTIKKAFGSLENLKILIIGGTHLRAFRSQIRAFANFPGLEIFILCPDKFWMEYADEQYYRENNISFQRISKLDDVKQDVDVIYHNGITEHRSEAVDSFYALDREKLSGIKVNCIILHSLPRVEDLAFDVDAMPQAQYFHQAHNGVAVRAAIVEHLLLSRI